METRLKFSLYKKPDDIIEAARIALKNRLYVSGWQLFNWFQTAKFYPTDVEGIVLAFREEIPVAVLFAYRDQTSGVFVRKCERRQGIGTDMVKVICESGFVPLFTAHDYRSTEFFEGLENRIEIEYEWMDQDEDV